MVRALFFFGLGILSAYHGAAQPLALQVACAVLIASLLTILLIEIFYRLSARRLSVCLLWLALALIGFILMGRALPSGQVDYFQKLPADRLIGVIADEPLQRGSMLRFPLRVQYALRDSMLTPAKGFIMVSIALPDSLPAEKAYAYGDQLLFEAKVSTVSPAHNPGQFDYKRYLAHKNIHVQGYYPDAEVAILAHDKGSALVAWALQKRRHLVAKFEGLLQREDALQLSSALIFGYRTNFNPELLQAFTNTGTIHVLSVSGLHVSIIFYLLHWLLRLMGRRPVWHDLRLLLILLAVWLYVLLTGMAPAILRAGFMISAFIVAELFRREQMSLNTLFLSAFIILILQPHTLFDMGFQLSYLAVFGLLTLYPLLLEAFPVMNKYLRFLQQFVLLSCVAQLFTTPLSIYYFHQFPNYFLLGNLFIALPSTLLMYAALLLAISPWQLLNVYVAKLLDQLGSFVIGGLQLIERLPNALFRGLHFSLAELMLGSLLLCLLLYTWLSRSKNGLWLLLATSCVLIVNLGAESIRLSNFRGLKVYNMQRDIAFAIIDRGRVFLYSNLDSLAHSKLRYHVWTDVERYCTIKQVQYQQIAPLRGKAMLVDALGLRLGIAEQLQDLPDRQDCDLLIYRGAHREDFAQLRQKMRRTLLILDGANSSLQLQAFQAHADSLGQAYYILKDNFSYVWEKQN